MAGAEEGREKGGLGVILEEIQKIKGIVEENRSKLQGMEGRLGILSERVEMLESSLKAINAGIMGGVRERSETQELIYSLYSSYEGFNTRRWINGLIL